MRQFFVKRLTLLAATSKLPVEQNLLHLGRFLHFNQKVVEVTICFKLTETKIYSLLIFVTEKLLNGLQKIFIFVVKLTNTLILFHAYQIKDLG